MGANGLSRPAVVRDQLLRYKTIIPKDRAAFSAFFDEIWPDKRGTENCDFGCAWYTEWVERWDGSLVDATVDAIQDIIDKYYPPCDFDRDSDGTPDCVDQCPDNQDKTGPTFPSQCK